MKFRWFACELFTVLVYIYLLVVGQGRIVSRSFYQNQNSDSKVGSNEESRVHTQEEDMEIGYEDDPSAKTLETLEQQFLDDITKLTKEHVDVEDAENVQHKEVFLLLN
ncbi:hypothetical protein Dimus_029241 [Dionaea muscipula]